MRQVWIPKTLLVFLSGRENSIFLSILPGLMRAGSKVSILLVAIITCDKSINKSILNVTTCLSISSRVKAIQLVKEFQHRPLDLPLPPTVTVVPLGPHGINLVDEDDAGAVLVSNTEELPDQFRTITKILLDEFTANLIKMIINILIIIMTVTHHSKEGGTGLVSHSLGQEGLASAGGAVQ